MGTLNIRGTKRTYEQAMSGVKRNAIIPKGRHLSPSERKSREYDLIKFRQRMHSMDKDATVRKRRKKNKVARISRRKNRAA